MSTSCVIAICDRKKDEIVLLEKTHDGFLENFENIINKAMCINNMDVEELVNYLIEETDIEFAIYSHKYPQYAYAFLVDEYRFLEIKINPDIEKIYDCLDDVKKAIA